MLLSYVGTVFSHDKLLLRQQPPSRKGDKSAQDSTWLWLVSCLSYLHIYITHMYTNCTNSDSCWIRCTPVTILYPHAHILKNSCFRLKIFQPAASLMKTHKSCCCFKEKECFFNMTKQNNMHTFATDAFTLGFLVSPEVSCHSQEELVPHLCVWWSHCQWSAHPVLLVAPELHP